MDIWLAIHHLAFDHMYIDINVGLQQEIKDHINSWKLNQMVKAQYHHYF